MAPSLVRTIRRRGASSFCAPICWDRKATGPCGPPPALISAPGAGPWRSSLARWSKPIKTRWLPSRAASRRRPPVPRHRPTTTGLQFFNGFGGFSADGREYVMVLNGGQKTPAPWINVIANSDFGFQVSAEGAGFCWAANSQQNQITPWSNDPVSNEPSEVVYFKDLDSGDVWSPTAEPITDPGARYTVRHGQGYSRFEYAGRELAAELTQFVPLTIP